MPDGSRPWVVPDIVFLVVPVICTTASVFNFHGSRPAVLFFGMLGCAYALVWFLGLFLGIGGGSDAFLGVLPAAVLWLLAGFSGLASRRGDIYPE